MEKHRLILGLSIWLILTTAVHIYAQQYTVTDLGDLQPVAVIDGPIVFGNLAGAPVVWEDGMIFPLQHYGYGGRVNGANARGDAVGVVFVPGTDGRLRDVGAFWYPDGAVALLPGMGQFEAMGLNMARTIAGANRTNGLAMRWYPEGTEEYLVNDRPLNGPAQAVGVDRWNRAWGSTGKLHEWQMKVWDVDGSVMVPPGLYTHSHRILAVNEDGVATGEYEDFSPPTDFATTTLRVTRDGATELPSLGGDTRECRGTAINARGDIGGSCVSLQYAGRNGRAVLWPAAGGLIDLSRDVPLPAPWLLVSVASISDDGHIAAYAAEPGPFTPRRAVLLSPVSVPPALALHMNRADFRPGESWQVSIERQGLADLHVAIILPDGITTLFLTNIETLSYIVSTIERGPYPTTSGATITYQWHGLEPHGVYHLVAALARPGSLQDGSIDEGDLLALDWKAFSFTGELIAAR